VNLRQYPVHHDKFQPLFFFSASLEFALSAPNPQQEGKKVKRDKDIKLSDNKTDSFNINM
jgi:hypothetical protein